MGDTLEDWVAALPPALHARLTEPAVIEWGFGAGPSFAAMHLERPRHPVSLEAALRAIFERRTVFRRAHIKLADGSTLLIVREAGDFQLRYTRSMLKSGAVAGEPRRRPRRTRWRPAQDRADVNASGPTAGRRIRGGER